MFEHVYIFHHVQHPRHCKKKLVDSLHVWACGRHYDVVSESLEECWETGLWGWRNKRNGTLYVAFSRPKYLDGFRIITTLIEDTSHYFWPSVAHLTEDACLGALEHDLLWLIFPHVHYEPHLILPAYLCYFMYDF